VVNVAAAALRAQLLDVELHSCRGFILPDIDQADRWLAHRPFLPRADDTEARCSYAIPMWGFFLRGLAADLAWHCSSATAAAALGDVLADSLASFASRYATLVFSRARQRTFSNDVLASKQMPGAAYHVQR
jgi:hypothetical protein